ncbi:SpoIIE family protein phosphatase [bacterium]|nr:SpoIIE family protein phosphatase [Bacteroidales bacterium]MCK5685888.1 SpoIIE family protein phosphatase [bacterium]
MKRKAVIFTIIICIFISIGLILYTHWIINELLKDNCINLPEFKSKGSIKSLSFQMLSPEQSGTFEYISHIDKSSFNTLIGKNYMLVMHGLRCRWYKVYFNGQWIGSVGDSVNGRSNIWNAMELMPIDKKMLQKRNELKLIIHATYEIGKGGFPIIITDEMTAIRIKHWYEHFSINFPLFAIGATFVSMLGLLMVFFSTGFQKKEYLCYSLSALFVLSFYIEGMYSFDIGILILNFKRMRVVSLHLSSILFSIGLFYQYREKLLLYFSSFQFSTLVFCIIFSKNMYIFKKNYTLLSFLIICNSIIALIILAKHLKFSVQARVMSISILFVFIFGSYEIITKYFQNFAKISLTNYGVLIFFLGIMLQIIFQYIDTDESRIFLQQRNKQIINELEFASKIQQALVAYPAINDKRINVSSLYIPSEELSGDFFDLVQLDENRYGIFIADVSGHGVSAALLSSMLKAYFRIYAYPIMQPSILLKKINDEIIKLDLSGLYFTSIYAILDLKEKYITLSFAGHPPVLFITKNMEIKEIKMNGFMAGIFENAEFKNTSIPIQSGEKYFFYTDGIIEAGIENKNMFGKQNFRTYLALHSKEKLKNIITTFPEYLSNEIGIDHFEDDISIIAVEIN